MAISQLNSFFAKHHRIIFGVFSIIIIIAFMDFLTPGTGLMDAFSGRGRTSDVGEIFGRKVSAMELNDQMQLDMLSAQIFMGMRIDSSMREQLEVQSFYNMAVLEAARRAGITASDEEVARFLRMQFMDEKGAFNKEAYLNFVNNYLAGQGFSEDDLNQAARNFLMLNKLQASLTSSVVVTPGESELFYNMLNERFMVLAADFKAADFAAKTELVQAELDEFFNANRAKYVIPAQMQALVISYPYADYRSEAIKTLKDEDLKAYYEKNPALFSKVTDGKVEVEPFDKVKDAVRSSAVAALARELAMNAAQQFGAQVYEAIGNAPAEQRQAIFLKAVADGKLKPQATGRFAADSKAAGKIEEPALVAEIASIFMDVPLTNAVAGKDAAYLAYVTEYVQSREAEFKEVSEQVTKDYLAQKTLKAARDRAAEVSASLKALPADGREARAKASKDPQFAALPRFSYQEGSKDIANLGALNNMVAGDVSDPIPTMDGAQVILLVGRHAPEKPFEAKPEADMMARGYKAMLMQEEFQGFLGANCIRYAQPAESEARAE